MWVTITAKDVINSQCGAKFKHACAKSLFVIP